ncbi:MAG: DUF4105 domain-containing protein [Gammaproteobacteria bacterium]|nr:DUF4105 domain-containing protein [Gammaproteobacteria bacterium]
MPYNTVYADEYVDHLIDIANHKKLDESRAWRALLHYKPGVINSWVSQADDTKFFLAKDGNINPQAELHATIQAIAESLPDSDQHSQCRFPARYYWLVNALKIDQKKILPVKCAKLDQWFDTIKPGSLSLIFPSAYVNSPSSMFGHTLLRVTPNDHRANAPLVAYALNYAADADATDNSLVFSIKGLIGGYPGIFSIVPYYEKLKEYSDIENRDVWEYSLNFSKAEVDQLMRHAWELQYINFDYYFLTENCSYHMLSLMEVARPELDLTDQFDVKAIPSDTVRAVINAGLVTKRNYRAASTTILTQHAKQMSANDNKLVIDISRDLTTVEKINNLDKTKIEKARIYEQAYDYSRFLSTSDPTVRDARAKTNWELLAARSKIETDGFEVWLPVKKPDVRVEDGHRTGRIALGLGEQGGDSYVNLKLRPAYHDVVDKVSGYSRGAQINFLDFELRYFNEDEKLRLQKFTAINVLSLTPRDRYFLPISWGIDIAVERQPTRNSVTNAVQAVVDFGVSKDLYNYAVISLMAELDMKVASKFEKGHSVGAGAVISLLIQESSYSLLSSLRSVYFELGEKNLHQQFDVAYGYHFSFNDSLRITYIRSRDYDIYSNDIQLTYQRYF